MTPFFFLTAAFSVVFVVLLFVAARYVDRRVKVLASDETVEVLQAQLNEALAEQARLRQRVENLEAIVTTEAWDTLHDSPGTRSGDLSDEERAAQLARRHRAR